jgi:FMN phosphatase YigB (HAD superfamily)
VKITNNLLLVTSIFCSTALAMETSYFAKASDFAKASSDTSKDKPIIITDFDDVWIKKSSFLGALAYLQPLENLFKSKKSSKEIVEQPTEPYSAEATKGEKKERKLGNLPLRLLDYGRRYPRLAYYMPGLVNYIGKSRCINQPIDNLYKHLKQDGYRLVIATNKDHMLYDLAIETLGNEIPNMVDMVFVAEPQSDANAIAQLQDFANKPTTPARYKNIVHKALNLKETNTIVHVLSKKPAKSFYDSVTQRIGEDNDMIFIDDNEENVAAFNALQKDTNHLRLGIVYNERNLNQFAEDIKKAGLVLETNDQDLLNEIRYPGMWGKIKLYTYQTFGRMKAATS